jgi:hypothetical protein
MLLFGSGFLSFPEKFKIHKVIFYFIEIWAWYRSEEKVNIDDKVCKQSAE